MTLSASPKASASWPFAWVVLIVCATAAPPAASKTRAGDDFLLPEQAFRLSARLPDERSVELVFDIAPGYYLYREQFRFDPGTASLGAVTVPTGQVKFDETFQKNVETHRGRLVVALPVQQANGAFRLSVNYQGCADKGLCYPPQQWQADVKLAAFGGVASLQPVTAVGTAEATVAAATSSAAVPVPEAATESSDARWWPWLGGAALLAAALAIWRRR